MRYSILLLLTSLLLLTVQGAHAQGGKPPQDSDKVAIFTPEQGQALQGIITISGNTMVPGFVSAEISFAYSDDLTDTWFLIYESTTAVSAGELTQWDTSTITDGDYSLRLLVTLEDGSQVVATITNLRLRNYTSIETITPWPSPTHSPGDTPVPSMTPTPTATPPPPTATALPRNPASISSQDLLFSMGKGVLAVIVIFTFIGIYQLIRSAIQR